VDWSDRYNADIKHDLNKFPHLFKKNLIDYIYFYNSTSAVEHLNNIWNKKINICIIKIVNN
jgi:hypothetical protein